MGGAQLHNSCISDAGASHSRSTIAISFLASLVYGKATAGKVIRITRAMKFLIGIHPVLGSRPDVTENCIYLESRIGALWMELISLQGKTNFAWHVIRCARVDAKVRLPFGSTFSLCPIF